MFLPCSSDRESFCNEDEEENESNFSDGLEDSPVQLDGLHADAVDGVHGVVDAEQEHAGDLKRRNFADMVRQL